MPPASERAVFLSYASQDADAARRICEALRAVGVEVWFDQSELTGGDAWDQKIRGQIGTCVLFAAVISAATQARREGYFRIEWKLAAQRTHAMADGTPFLPPIVIDGTKDSEALVPEEFRAVQWTSLPNGETNAAFCERVKTLLSPQLETGRPRPVQRDEGVASPAQVKVGWRVPVPAWIAAGAAIALTVGGYFWLKPPTEPAPLSVQNAGAGTRPPALSLPAVSVSNPSNGPTAEFSAPSPNSILPSPSGRPQADQKSVAVLAFKNLSGDPAREFFSDGLSEAVTDVLGRVPGLKVVGSASAFSFKGKSVSIPEIARQLGVTHLVEGTVLQEGQTVRITAKLIKADGFQVWGSDTLTRELKNIFALHDEVAGLIAKNLSLKLGASSAASKAAVNPEAFELYLQARQALNLLTPEGYDRAESALNRALALEPNFARAHAALADVWSRRFMRAQRTGAAEDQSHPNESARIRAKITQALTLDPDSSEAHTSLGFSLLVDGKYSEAESALRRAVALNPNDAPAQQWLGRALFSQGQMDEALERLRLATQLDPLSWSIWNFYGEGLLYAGRRTEGISAMDRGLTLIPDYSYMVARKSFALVELGRVTEAVALVRRMTNETYTTAGARLRVFAQASLKAEAEALLAASRSPVNISFRWAAGSLVALGRTDEALALRLLKSSLSDVSDALWDPIFDPVRNDPRWVKLMAEAGLTESPRPRAGVAQGASAGEGSGEELSAPTEIR